MRGDVRLDIVAGIDPGGATAQNTLRQLHALENRAGVTLSTEAALAQILDGYGPGSMSLDLYDTSLERQLAIPVRSVNALVHGVPILTNIASTMMRGLERRGGACIVNDDLEFALDRLGNLSAAGMADMSAAASNFAAEHFNQADSTHTLLEQVAAISRRKQAPADHLAAGPRTFVPAFKKAVRQSKPQVLVFSEESRNMRQVRVETPFDAMYREGLIGGYAVLHNGRIEASTSGAGPGQTFDAIWVQRRLAPEMSLALHSLKLPFVLDMDDNLLVSPAYREAFSAEMIQASRFLARTCTVLATSTARLAELIQKHAHATLIDKVAICPNVLSGPFQPAPQGDPQCLIWASSDMPALMGEGRFVIQAVRDFCLATNLRVVSIGAPPPPLLLESAVEVEHVGLLAYPAYMALLRSAAPAIVICPLETGDVGITRDFIDGKSDIKMLEAMAAGLVGVFSAAKPYLESNLPAPILCENDYRSWFNALIRARTACRESARAAIPPDRVASGAGLWPWAAAIERARHPAPFRLSDIHAALGLMQSRLTRSLVDRKDFDAAWYAARNSDVHSSLENGEFLDAYDHYLSFGYRERRPGNSDDVAAEAGHAQFWLNLTQTLSDMRQSIENRQPAIEEFKARRAARQALR